MQDVVIRYNTVRHVNGGVNILGRDYQSATGSQQAKRISILNNVFDDVGGTWGGGAQWILMSRSPATITVDHNTVFHTGHVVFVDNGTVSGFVFRNNMAKHNEYGIAGSGASFGLTAITAYFPGSVVTKNVLAGGSASRYPAGNFFPTVTAWLAEFVNASAGDYHLKSTSPYRNAGTDGLDLGANLTALAAAQKGSAAADPPATGNQPPTAAAGGPYTATAGVSLSVSGAGSRDADGTIASYKWSWGDGTAAGAGVTPSHTYAAAGTYTLTLTVADNAGASASASTTVTVKTGAGDIVLTAADVTAIKGAWSRVLLGQPRQPGDGRRSRGGGTRRARWRNPRILRSAVRAGREHAVPRVAATVRAIQGRRLRVGAVHRRGRRECRAALGVPVPPRACS